ncbi:MAG: hypothetical protein ACYTXC_18620 [Nostoc sp.]
MKKAEGIYAEGRRVQYGERLTTHHQLQATCGRDFGGGLKPKTRPVARSSRA